MACGVMLWIVGIHENGQQVLKTYLVLFRYKNDTRLFQNKDCGSYYVSELVTKENYICTDVSTGNVKTVKTRCREIL